MRNRLIIISLFILIAILAVITLVFNQPIFFRLEDSDTDYGILGTGTIVIKNPFRSKKIEEKLKMCFKDIHCFKKKPEEIIEEYFDPKCNFSISDLNIHAQYEYISMNVWDIFVKEKSNTYLVDLKPVGKGYVTVLKKNEKIINFFIFY